MAGSPNGIPAVMEQITKTEMNWKRRKWNGFWRGIVRWAKECWRAPGALSTRLFWFIIKVAELTSSSKSSDNSSSNSNSVLCLKSTSDDSWSRCKWSKITLSLIVSLSSSSLLSNIPSSSSVEYQTVSSIESSSSPKLIVFVLMETKLGRDFNS